jgi:twitching motility protein PilT
VRNLIREGKTHQIYSVIQTGSSFGMQTMDSALAALVRAGKITRSMAESRAAVPAELTRLLGDAGGAGGMLAAPALNGASNGSGASSSAPPPGRGA